MSTKITDLAEKLGLSQKELKEKINELGFEISPRARVLDDEVAELVSAELSDSSKDESFAENEDYSSGDVAEIYDEIIAMEREREIVKSQRKMSSSKDAKALKSAKKETEKIEEKSRKQETIEIPDLISVKEFAEKSGIAPAKIIGELMKNGILANINQRIDFETALIISDDLGIKLSRIRTAALAEDFLQHDISRLIKEDDPFLLRERPPVVVIMGHVDHGKTKLLDFIRHSDIVSGESGGITQHIGAYQVEKNGKAITFLDTPGHEAFTAMRARGAKVTDIAVLVVAADEGVKPQTVEAINHAKEANVPIIVALNKMDKPDANPEKVMGELTEHDLQPEAWGGGTIMVNISALTGQGVEDLLEMILLTAEMETLKANPDREAVGTVIESHLNSSLGPVATILVNTGTLHVKDYVIVGQTYGRVKLMRDYKGNPKKIAGPSTPVFVAGFHETPKSGDILQVVKNEQIAKQRASEIKLIEKQEADKRDSGLNLLISKVKSDKILKVVLKADAKGSIEAIRQSLAKIKDEEVAVKIIHSGVGTITESDIIMASASHGIVFGFHSDFNSPNVKRTADRENVEVRKYTVIYNLIEDVKKILSGLLEPEMIEKVIGRARVKQVFFSKKQDMILGCSVLSGKLESKAKVRVFRDEEVLGEGELVSIRKVDKEVKEINEGNDCGLKFHGNVAIQENDEFQAFVIEKKVRTVQ